jgi:NAD+ kinase
MKIRLTGKNLQDIRPLLAKYGLVETDGTPDVVISHGGDGAMLGAVREYSGLPIFPIRDAGTAPLCDEHRYEMQLAALQNGKLSGTVLPMVAGEVNGRMVYGINDVFLHHADPTSALRYRVVIDGELYANEVVGDGIGISSIHGSTAYYRSITHSLFRVGIGLAFSNSTEEVNHLVLSEKSEVLIEIVRGPGVLVADNSPEQIAVSKGDIIKLFQTEKTAELLGLCNFMCPKCRVLRHPNKLPFRGFFCVDDGSKK